ncbi:Uncharacterized protein OS=Candidatus Entotheonella sp. TSY1 GN=ETSY1_25480 PE=4 SV=1: DUF4058 [Gemmataceae bacterium]|nr:Uncharacterized protein OS=Candidatus Entotheonella sp. TSY1 GN=ETSY1_25480 PE=4 SV=1: DUF4058 [Gemmataceae bacterium]VTT96672.1 Uncharacterized protein OS=Candidatus Entotheonella sp. TSY1 GN=ETSY1_25480 PE=4 SV=1: DUF4058 [Gemmataceae bacterium]
MPMHDWTRVEAGTYHDFHLAWIAEIRKTLNSGVLPPGYYAMAEQHAGDAIPDVIGLHESDPDREEVPDPFGGGVATLTKTKPKVAERLTSTKPLNQIPRRRVAIRHTSGHRIVAFIELVSPSNKDRVESVAGFTAKVAEALRSGVHILVVDPFPPGPADPLGMHGAVWRELTGSELAAPADRPVTLAAYAAGRTVEAFVNRLAPGEEVPEMPVFLTPTKYVPLALESTYMAASAGMPEFWRKVLEKQPA